MMDLDEALALKNDLIDWNQRSGSAYDEIRIVTYDGSMFWVEAYATEPWNQSQLIFSDPAAFMRFKSQIDPQAEGTVRSPMEVTDRAHANLKEHCQE
ncbi:MAG: hypothetical protein ACR2JC_14290 [Chloroflexota bacterium]